MDFDPSSSGVSESTYSKLISLLDEGSGNSPWYWLDHPEDSSNVALITEILETVDLQQRYHVLTSIHAGINLLCRARNGPSIAVLLRSLPEDMRLDALIESHGSSEYADSPIFVNHSLALPFDNYRRVIHFVKALLEVMNMSDRPKILRQQDKEGNTLLHKAIKSIPDKMDEKPQRCLQDFKDILISVDPSCLTSLLQISNFESFPVAHSIFDGRTLNPHKVLYAILSSLPADCVAVVLGTADNEGLSLFSKVIKRIRFDETAVQNSPSNSRVLDGQVCVKQFSETCLGIIIDMVNKDELISLLSMRDIHGRPAILNAMQLETLRIMFKTGMSEKECLYLLELQDNNGDTVLHKVSYGGSQTLYDNHNVDLLVDCFNEVMDFVHPSSLPALFLINNCSGSTPFSRLMVNAKLTQCLMERSPLSKRLDMVLAQHLFHQCIGIYRDTAIVILRSLADESERFILLRSPNQDGNTPLHVTSWLIEVLSTVSQTAREKLIMLQNRSGDTPFHKLMLDSDILRKNMEPDKLFELMSIQNSVGDTILHHHVCLLQPGLSPGSHRDSTDLNDTLLFLSRTQNVMPIMCLQNEKGETVFHSLVNYLQAPDLPGILRCINESHRYETICIQDIEGETALHKLDFRDTETFMSILKCFQSADIGKVLSLANTTGDTIIHLVVGSSYHALKRTMDLIPEESRLHLLSNQNNDGKSPLHVAARSSAMAVELVLSVLDSEKRNKLIALKDKKGNTAIQDALISTNFRSLETITASVGLPVIFQSLGIDLDYDVLRAAITAEQHNTVKLCIQNLDFKKRGLVRDLIETNPIATSCLGMIVDRLNEEEIQEIEAFISDSSPEAIEEDWKRLERLRFCHSDSIIHLLAERKDTVRLEKLLRACDENQRYDLMSIRNSNGQTALESARSYEVRRRLEWSTQQAGFYYLSTQPVVVVLYSTVDRDGAEQETSELMKVLPDFNVHVIQRRDPRKQQILDAIREAQQKENISALVVIIMSHGVQGSVCASDGDLNIQEILLQMCPASLEGKPKVLMVQACQTRDHTLPSRVTAGIDPAPPASQPKHPRLASPSQRQTPIVHDRRPEEYRIPSRDVITMMATVSGNLAYRNLMIPMFAEELRDSKDGDIYDIFLTTHCKMRDKLKDTPGQDQIPEFRSTLTQKLCLRKIFKQPLLSN